MLHARQSLINHQKHNEVTGLNDITKSTPMFCSPLILLCCRFVRSWEQLNGGKEDVNVYFQRASECEASLVKE